MSWHSESIDFSTEQGQLHGEILLPKGEGPFPGAVLCHGMGSDHRAMRPSAQRLVRRGIATLTFDFRGHGRSDGVLDGDLVQDVTAALEFLRRHVKIDPHRIALVGHSMGAMAALHAAAALSNIQALVFLSSPGEINGRFAQVWAPLYPKAVRAGSLIIEFPHIGSFPMLGRLQGMLSRLWMWLRGYRLRINLEKSMESWAKLNPSIAIEKIGAFPKLFVHCKGDKLTPYEGALKLYEKAAPPKEFLLSKGGFHAAPLFPGKLRGKWIAWLVSILT